MGLSSAINASLSGLQVTGKWAELTSKNIANITTEGYGRKTLQLSSGPGGGVRVGGIQREVDVALNRLHHGNIAKTHKQDAIVKGLVPYTSVIGGPDSPLSLSNQLGRFQGELGMLVNDPGNEGLQRAAVSSATALTTTLHRASEGIEEARRLARASAASDTAEANTLLTRVGMLGRQAIQEADGSPFRASIEDDIARELDKLAKVMDFRIERSPRGDVSLFTTSGAPLVVRNESAGLRYDQQSGQIFTGEIEITPGGDGRRGITEGRLAGHVLLDREILAGMQGQLDEMARSLIAGFAAVDPTVGPGEGSVFVDPDPGSVAPLASRITVNPTLLPEMGGSPARLRDGAGAVTPSYEGDNRQLLAFVGVLSATQSFSPDAGLLAEGTLADFAAVLTSEHQYVRVRAEEARDDFRLTTESVGLMRSGIEGVNLDEELQRLLTIEQNYAANATVMKSLNEMLDTLLAIA